MEPSSSTPAVLMEPSALAVPILRERSKSRELLILADKPTTGDPSRNITRKEKRVVKKQGGGGKAKWHVDALVSLDDVGPLGTRDPICDSDEGDEREFGDVVYGDTEERREIEPGVSLAEFKRACVSALSEYWMSEDAAEVARCIMELDSPIFHYELVKRGVSMAMGRNDRERELLSRLLSELYPGVLNSTHIGCGFERLFESIDDLEIDIPRARPMLAAFVARSVVDEVLPPVFLVDPVIRRVGGDIVEQAQRLLSMKHAIPRIEKVWGPGDGRPVAELKTAVEMLASEFLGSADSDEAVRCAVELNVPHFMHELVKRCVAVTLDRRTEDQLAMSALLARLHSEAVVGISQMELGFARLYEAIDDLRLDTPNAPAVLAGFKERAVAAGYLPASWVPPAPLPLDSLLPPPPPAAEAVAGDVDAAAPL